MPMRSRSLYAIAGLFVGAAVDILINLLAAGIQQRAFLTQFSDQALWILAGLAVLGLLVGFWLGAHIQVPAATPTQTASNQPASTQKVSSQKQGTVTITRLRALLSYGKLKGQGIHLSDILLLGSRIDIET